MTEINYKQHLERYQAEIRDIITDIKKRIYELYADMSSLSVYVQSGIFYNCVAGMENKSEKARWNDFGFDETRNTCYEVIGNIYENPALLKDGE